MLFEGLDVVEHHESQQHLPPTKVTKGVLDSSERNYSILKKVEKINFDPKSLAKQRSSSRARSASRDSRLRAMTAEKPSGKAGNRQMLPPSNKDARPPKPNKGKGTMMSLGGVAVMRERSVSKQRSAFKDARRARSQSRGPETRGPDGGNRRGRSRSVSRMRRVMNEVFRGRSRSSSRRVSPSPEPHTRGRSVNRREGPVKSKTTTAPNPPNEVQPSESSTQTVAPKVEVEDPEIETEPELILKEESEIDNLKDHDVMQLDEKNTVVHVACLIHHKTKEILERLEEDSSLAFELNNADELPLHYAAMDKKGVNHEVLKKLLTLNPEAVKQRNVQNSLPIHLACMVGAPSKTALKTFLKMYPKSAMIQSEFPLLFERDMIESVDESPEYDSDDDDFVAYSPRQVSKTSGLASYFACTSPNQAELELMEEAKRRKEEAEEGEEEIDEGPQIETGFSPLHLAVMNSAHPSIIELLVKISPKCIHLKTSKGRTALACAQYIVRQHWLYGTDDEGVVQNTFAAIEILEDMLKQATEDP